MTYENARYDLLLHIGHFVFIQTFLHLFEKILDTTIIVGFIIVLFNDLGEVFNVKPARVKPVQQVGFVVTALAVLHVVIAMVGSLLYLQVGQ